MRLHLSLPGGLRRSALVSAVLLSACAQPNPDDVGLLVETAQGPVRGIAHGQGVHAWLAIPYAAAPIDSLRWHAPQPPEHWRETRDADTYRSACTQPRRWWSSDATAVHGSEDCLYLNVFAPAESLGSRPVLIWLHGGGNYSGQGNLNDPAILVQSQDVLVVSFNYRLGPLGWFHHPAIAKGATGATGGSEGTGSFGLLDMIAVLRWVRDNIAAFGGDPDNVTLLGESTGGHNVYALLLSNAARGLFHRVIAQSGGLWNMTLEQALNYPDDEIPGSPASARQMIAELWVDAGRAEDAAQARLQLSETGDRELERWLRGLDAESLMAPYLRQTNLGYELPSVVYDGVMFPRGDTGEVIAAATWAREIPVIVGSNRDDQKAFQYEDPTLVESAGTGSARIIEPARYEALNRYYSGWWTGTGVNEVAQALTTLGHEKVFAYRFDWDDLVTQPVDLKALIGAAHALELPFVFGDFSVGYLSELAFTAANFEGRQQLSSTMMSYWSEFALNGEPGRGRNSDLPHWRAWRADLHNKLIFDEIKGGGVRMAVDRLDMPALYGQMFADPNLGSEETCRMYALFTMYPSYDLDGWARYGCSEYVINVIKSDS